MELASYKFDADEVVICPLGDIQWAGPNGQTADDLLRKHIDICVKKKGHFVGTGDYTDFMSPSNRQRLENAGLYDTSRDVIEKAARRLAQEVYDEYLVPTTGRWLGLIEGHHYFKLADGTTTDTYLAGLLETKQLGTLAMIRIQYGKSDEVVLWVHHGKGGGGAEGSPLNSLERVAKSWEADVFLMGHTCKTPATRYARVRPKWDDATQQHDLEHREILLVNTGGFNKSAIVGSRQGQLPRGGYAEAAMYAPVPLSAPILYLRPGGVVRVEV